MVRKSLAETLSNQAREFLEQGKPSNSSAPVDLNQLENPLNGIDRSVACDFWSSEQRANLRRLFLERYRHDLERAGMKVTSAGLVDQQGSPTTRGLDKEIRALRREVLVLSEVTRQLLRIVVMSGACSPEQLLDYLAGTQRDAVNPPSPSQPADEAQPEPAPVKEPVAETPAPEPTPVPVVEEEDSMDEDTWQPHTSPFRRPPAAQESRPSSPPAAAPAKAAAAAPRTNGDAPRRPTAKEMIEAENPERPRIRRSMRGETPSPLSRFRVRPKGKEPAPKTEPAPSSQQKPAAPSERTKPRVSAGPVRLKVCPRCQKKVPFRVPRCLACGRRF